MTDFASAQIDFRRATDADVDWLVALRIATMRGYIEASGTRLSDSEQRARVLQDFDCIRIVRVMSPTGPEDVGMMKVVRGASVWTLVQIQIVPARQGQQIGGRLVEGLQRDATDRGVPVELSVLKVNPARRLYARLGFEVVKEKRRSWEMRWAAGVIPAGPGATPDTRAVSSETARRPR